MKINVYNQAAEVVSELELSDKVFGVKPNLDLIHQAVIAQMANERQVLADTKDRSEVRGGGKKPWKQKGTGRARVGSSRSPIWIGGGVTFGPTKDRNFSLKINKKMKQKAILMVLSDKVANAGAIVIDEFKIDEFKTKKFNEILSSLEKNVLKSDRRSLLVINDARDEKIKYSGRNLVGVEIINLENINIVDLIRSKNLLLTVQAAKVLEERYK
jgi:large subunit ribosomal protein L4